VSCAICTKRKEKRFCLAVHGRICSQCCGEQREITLDCPESCPYLQQARVYEPARTQEQMEGEELFLDVDVGQQFYYEREPLIAGLLFALARLGTGHRDWNDRDLIRGLTAFTRSYQRLTNSGIIYEESTTNPVHQAIADDLRRRIDEYRALEQQKLGYFSLKDSEVLKALVFLVRTAQSGTNGRPRSRAFLAQLASRFAAAAAAEAPTGSKAGSSLIVPG
jgi:hypothetical protein